MDSIYRLYCLAGVPKDQQHHYNMAWNLKINLLFWIMYRVRLSFWSLNSYINGEQAIENSGFKLSKKWRARDFAEWTKNSKFLDILVLTNKLRVLYLPDHHVLCSMKGSIRWALDAQDEALDEDYLTMFIKGHHYPQQLHKAKEQHIQTTQELSHFLILSLRTKKIYLTYDMWGSVLRSTSHQKAFRFLCRGDSTASSHDPPKNNPGLEMLIASSSAHVCSTARVDRSHCPQWPQETAQMTKMMTTSNCHCWQPLLKQK